ncbi:MAG: aspartate racemase [Alphaproteobacteria bacterium]|jgi:aspartate racemase|nr:aspartate racemase [Alphaproteobacteria bacterium]
MSAKEGRCLGLIGGLGSGATVYYYRGLLAEHEAAGRVPRMLIAHADVNRVMTAAGAKDFAGLADYLAGLIGDVKAGGAEMTAIVALTPHICVPQLTPISPLPLIDMVSEVAAEISARGLQRVAMFGTRFTVETRMFGRLDSVDVVMPKPDEIELIHNTYADVVAARSTSTQIDGLRRLAHTFIERDGAEAILLAGTDLSTVFDQTNIDFPAIDCAAVHIRAITQRLLE